MNVTIVLDENMLLFITSAKIPERDGSVSPSSICRQLPDY